MHSGDGDHRDGPTTPQSAAAIYSAVAALDYVATVDSAVQEAVVSIIAGTDNAKGLDFAKGDAAEFWHAGTFNIDAARRGHTPGAWAPRDTSVRDIILPDGTWVQAKYNHDAATTAGQISRPSYDGCAKLVPSDQLLGVRDQARRGAAGNADARPDLSESYRHTAATADDRLRCQGDQSRPLTEQQARDLVADVRDDHDLDVRRWELTTEQAVRLQDITRQALRGGAEAAALAAAVQMVPAVVSTIRALNATGELDLDALSQSASTALGEAARSGVTASITRALVAGARAGSLGAALGAVPANVIAAAVVLAVTCLRTAYRAAVGYLNWAQASDIMVHDSLLLAGMIACGWLGQHLIPVPILGALIGSAAGAILAGAVLGRVDEAIINLAITRGWRLLGGIEQDYTVPESVLRAAGFAVTRWHRISTQGFHPQAVHPRTIATANLPLHVIERALTGARRVGYRQL